MLKRAALWMVLLIIVYATTSWTGSIDITIVGSYASLQTLTGAAAINCGTDLSHKAVPVVGSGEPVDLSALNPQIAAGVQAGQLCDVLGTSDTNTVTLGDGNGLALLDGEDIVLDSRTTLALRWTGSIWRERGRTGQRLAGIPDITFTLQEGYESGGTVRGWSDVPTIDPLVTQPERETLGENVMRVTIGGEGGEIVRDCRFGPPPEEKCDPPEIRIPIGGTFILTRDLTDTSVEFLGSIENTDGVAAAVRTGIFAGERNYVHATDCTALSEYAEGSQCWEKDSNRLFICEPTAGMCDTPGEWIEHSSNPATIPVIWDLDLASVIGGTAAHIWNDDPLSAAGACTPLAVVGTRRAHGACQFPNLDGDYGVQITRMLPTGWTGTLDAQIWWKTTGTGNARFQMATKCYADDALDDEVFNATSIVTAAAGTSGRPNRQAMTGITVTGCAADQLLRLRFWRNRTEGSDTLTAALDVEKIVFTLRVTP